MQSEILEGPTQYVPMKQCTQFKTFVFVMLYVHRSHIGLVKDAGRGERTEYF